MKAVIGFCWSFTKYYYGDYIFSWWSCFLAM